MADSVALYFRILRARVRAQAQYRVSLALEIVGVFLVTGLDFAAVLILFHNVPALDGWTVAEVGFLYAVSTIAFALTDLGVGHLDEFPQLIRDGSFDLFLVRPRGTLFQVVTANFSLRRLGKALQGIAVLVWAVTALEVDWMPGRVAMVPVMVVFGAVIFASVWIAAICVVFWAIEGRETASAFSYGGQFLTQYPVTVYDRWLRRLVAYVIPMAFVCYFPSLYVLGKAEPAGLPGWISFVSPAAAVAAAVAAGGTWRFAVRHYRSAGG